MTNSVLKSNLLEFEITDFPQNEVVTHNVPDFLELKAIQICWDIDVEQDSSAS